MSFKHLLFIVFIASIFLVRQFEINQISKFSKNPRILQTSNLTVSNVNISSQCKSNLSSYLTNANESLYSLQSIISTYQPNNQLNQYIAGNITFQDYQESLYPYAIPFIVFSVLSGLVLIGSIIGCLCFPKICCISNKYTENQQRCCLWPQIIFGLFIVIISIATFIINALFYNGVVGLSCDIEGGYSTLLNGATTSNLTWGGLNGIVNQLNNLSNGLYQYGTFSSAYFNNASFLNTSIPQLYGTINQISETFSNLTLPNPNPFSATGTPLSTTLFNVKIYKYEHKIIILNLEYGQSIYS